MDPRRDETLSAYLDGELPPGARARLEARLAEDAGLRELLEELRRVRDAAAELENRPPETDLWPGIEGRIREAGERGATVVPLEARHALPAGPRRFSFTVPQLAAAAVAMMLLGSGVLWVASEFGAPGPVAVRTVDGGGAEARLTAADAESAEAASTAWDDAIRDLEERLAVDRDRLDTATVRIIEESLETIDRAIAQARSALEQDPGNVYLNRHLANARARKLQLLRQANALLPART